MIKGPRVFQLCILLFFVLFIPSWIIQALALLLLLTLVLCYLYASMGYSYVVAKRRETTLRAHRAQEIEVRIDVENRSFLPIHFILIRDTTGFLFANGSDATFFLNLRAWEKRRIIYQVESRDRGEFEIGPIVVKGSDPLGFFPWQKRIEEITRLIVYPRILPLKLLHPRGLPAGNIRSENKIYEDVTRYRSLKEYTPGDDTRRIHWKVSARLGDLYCMEYLPALSFPVVVLLSLTGNDYPGRYRSYWMERAIEVAASLCHYFIGLDQEVGLVTSGTLPEASDYVGVPIGRSYTHAMILLEHLARLRAGRQEYTGLLFQAGFPISLGSRILVVGPLLKREQLAFLQRLSRRGYAVEQYLVSPSMSAQWDSLGFPCYPIKDYGDELLEKRLVQLL